MTQEFHEAPSTNPSPKPKRNYNRKPKGLGDTVENVLEATGIAKVVKAIAPDCGCEERKAALNRLVPYFQPMTSEQQHLWKTVIKPQWTNGTLNQQAQSVMMDMYMDVFKIRRKLRRCSACAKSMLLRLEQAFEASCEQPTEGN